MSNIKKTTAKYFWDFLLRARRNESRRYIKDDYEEQKKLYETFKKIATDFKELDLETFNENIAKEEQKDINSSIMTKHLYYKMSHNIWQDRTISYLLDKEIDKKINNSDKVKVDSDLIRKLREDTEKLLEIYKYKQMQRKNYIPLAYENLAKINYLLGEDEDYATNINNATEKAVETNKRDFILHTRITKAYLYYLSGHTNNSEKLVNEKILKFIESQELEFHHLNFDVYILAIMLNINSNNYCDLLKQHIRETQYKFRCSRIKAMIPKCYKSLESKCPE